VQVLDVTGHVLHHRVRAASVVVWWRVANMIVVRLVTG